MSQIIDLVRKAQHGDEDAFLQLFQTCQVEVYRMAYVYLKNKEDALDVVQETAYRSFKTIKTLKKPQYFKTWLIKIAINVAHDLLRKNKKIVYLDRETLGWIGQEDYDVATSITLNQIVEALTDQEKSIIFLKFYSDFTLKEIAQVKDIPLGTAKTILYRALDKLRKMVKEEKIYE
ncbi:sigma-70 family RNA polymerase sigma factor [Bacillus sp. JJ722]|uniref:sigma-70 family RNA polymerase sigma factor n=1 Tax=Bacillus sp. JJ722 TaxID=3122973 RepID=UPI002FFE19A4